MNKDLNQKAAGIMSAVKNIKPLIHHITNFVVMNDTANMTLALGALPVMAHAMEETVQMTKIANALLVNIGTLAPCFVNAILASGKAANKNGVPVIFDPVGAGATSYRTKTSLEIMSKIKLAVIKGNNGEISALAGEKALVKGVESIDGTANPENTAIALAKKYQTTVIITGKRDVITNGCDVYYVDNGHELLSTLTGTGCMATTIVAVFAAVEKNYALAAAAALSYYGVAAEYGARKAAGPASFKMYLFDWLYNLTPEIFVKNAKITYHKA